MRCERCGKDFDVGNMSRDSRYCEKCYSQMRENYEQLRDEGILAKIKKSSHNESMNEYEDGKE